ncbi:Mitogen-activated protein kinase kinase kinase [Aphelenchoides besseyi]|nr:Mitogen-activated protein kinase kinase kinase [Aphelenchoides besseyi]
MPPTEYHNGTVLVQTTVSTTQHCHVPANTLVGTAGERQIAEQQTNLEELNRGHFGFSSYFNCLLTPFSAWTGVAARQKALGTADILNDNFEISIECIDVDFSTNYVGGGNQSSVFWGKWNGKVIALKKLNRACEVDIRKLVALDHPNVVQTLGICSTTGNFPCIISEFCEKGSLFDVLRRIELGKSQFLRWCQEVAHGMSYLHSLRIVHRDLKSPNILVNVNDTLKICDFGSLYTMDATHMASAKMSIVGTSQWMSPELLRNRPCNEKLDVWSYGVVLWELLTQEIPFKNISSAAVIFGVGSGSLRLHCPKTAPATYATLLKNCFAPNSRNRPSFNSILKHLSNLVSECETITADAWSMRKETWRKELNEEAEKLRVNSNGNVNEDAKQASAQQAEELVSRRMHELRHAQELASMYKDKMRRANRLNKELYRCLQELSQREATIAEKEDQLRVRAETAAPGTSGHRSPPRFHKMASGSVPELKSIRLEKLLVAKANSRGRTSTNVYPRGGQRAFLTVEMSDDDQMESEVEEEEPFESDAESEKQWNQSCNAIPAPNIAANSNRRISIVSLNSSSDDEVVHPRSRHSYAASSRQDSFEEGRGFSSASRAASARSSIAHRHPSNARNASTTYLPTNDDDSFVCPHCSCNCRSFHFGTFQRNSTTRVSGISADSGVVVSSTGTEERRLSALMLDAEENGNNSNFSTTLTAYCPLYRNDQTRWSDGKIAHRNQYHSFASKLPTRNRSNTTHRHSGAFTRNSPARSTKRHVTQTPVLRRPIKSVNSVDCVHESFDNHRIVRQQIHRSRSVSSRSDLHVAHNTNEEADIRMETSMETSVVAGSRYKRRAIDEVIAEMSSSLSSKSNRSSKKAPHIGMEQSTSSTMASSLERSLEAALADGLSDKEQKLKTVKASFRTHRRCASNPTCIVDQTKCSIARIAETGSETSDHEPVYC